MNNCCYARRRQQDFLQVTKFSEYVPQFYWFSTMRQILDKNNFITSFGIYLQQKIHKFEWGNSIRSEWLGGQAGSANGTVADRDRQRQTETDRDR